MDYDETKTKYFAGTEDVTAATNWIHYPAEGS